MGQPFDVVAQTISYILGTGYNILRVKLHTKIIHNLCTKRVQWGSRCKSYLITCLIEVKPPSHIHVSYFDDTDLDAKVRLMLSNSGFLFSCRHEVYT